MILKASILAARPLVYVDTWQQDDWEEDVLDEDSIRDIAVSIRKMERYRGG